MRNNYEAQDLMRFLKHKNPHTTKEIASKMYEDLFKSLEKNSVVYGKRLSIEDLEKLKVVFQEYK